MLKKAHVYFYLFAIILVFTLLYPFLYFFSRKPERYKTLNKFRYVLALSITALSGFFFKFRFEQNIDWSKKYIICPNHSSNLDIFVCTLLMRTNFAFLGKEELLGNPVTGLFFTTIDIPLNRDSKISSFRAFKRAGEYLQKGMSLIIFPEGKIDEAYPPVLQPFKNGPFRLAIEQGAAIIPVTITDAWKLMWDDGKTYGTTPGIAHICVHKPIETSGMSVDNADILKEQVFDVLSTELAKQRSQQIVLQP
jgi:1-acyl-sn-glycerol-3-phosphate acyltransferase